MSRALITATGILAVLLAVLTGGTSSAFTGRITNSHNTASMAYVTCRAALFGSADGVYPRANFLETLGGSATSGTLPLNDLAGNHSGMWDSNVPSREVALKQPGDPCARDAADGEDRHYSKLNYTTGGPRHWANTSNRFDPSTTTSNEIWFRTTSAGGLLMGIGDKSSAAWNFAPGIGNYSAKKDRQLYIDSSGRLAYALYQPSDGRVTVVRSPGPVTDGRWHHAVGVQSAAGTFLYLDGVRVASGPANSGETCDRWGYIHIGADNLGGWGDTPQPRSYFIGDLMMAAFYQTALSDDAVRMHYRAGV